MQKGFNISVCCVIQENHPFLLSIFFVFSLFPLGFNFLVILGACLRIMDESFNL